MNYIGVENPQNYDSIKNLNAGIEICDEINIYDNTKKIEEIAYLVNETVKWKSENMPKWSGSILK